MKRISLFTGLRMKTLSRWGVSVAMTDKSSQDLFAGYVPETLRRANEGDREAALEAIEIALAELLQGSIDRDLGLYLAICFQKALADKDNPDFLRAFNLSRSRGRPNISDTADRDSDIAIWVHLAVEQRGHSLADAKAWAGDLFGVENIDRALRNAGEVKDCNVLACEKHFDLTQKALPAKQ